MNNDLLHKDALGLLMQLIAMPSFSREEGGTADILANFLAKKNIRFFRNKNNVWAVNVHADKSKPAVLLNSHHDTVKPNSAYTRDPFQAEIIDGKLYGLGSTDAGASLVSLIACFVHYYSHQSLKYNLVLAASAEEEISGREGIELLFGDEHFSQWFQHPDSFAIVGEPTELNLAISEKGLLVLDCVASGKPGHAARSEGDNALYKAMDAISWFRSFRFEKISSTLGEIKMTVTSIDTLNKAHNVIPDQCSFVVDIRLTDAYTHEEILDIIRSNVDVSIFARSTRIRPSLIAIEHPIVQAGMGLGKSTYGSPTTSDQALIPLPSLKCGPGFSGQSHSADEFVDVQSVSEAIDFYIRLLNKIL